MFISRSFSIKGTILKSNFDCNIISYKENTWWSNYCTVPVICPQLSAALKIPDETPGGIMFVGSIVFKTPNLIEIKICVQVCFVRGSRLFTLFFQPPSAYVCPLRRSTRYNKGVNWYEYLSNVSWVHGKMYW